MNKFNLKQISKDLQNVFQTAFTVSHLEFIKI